MNKIKESIEIQLELKNPQLYRNLHSQLLCFTLKLSKKKKN